MYNQEAMAQAGQQRLRSQDKMGISNGTRQVASQYTKQLYKGLELSEQAMMALFIAIMNGEWDDDTIMKRMGSTPIDLGAVTAELNQVGILKCQKFSKDVIDDLVLMIEQFLAYAPAQMFPSTERPAPWTGMDNDVLNMKFVKVNARYHKAMSYDSMPKVYDAANKLQDVAFEINPALLGYFKYACNGNMSKSHVAQIEAQKQLIQHLVNVDEVFFYVTLDYRGRMYYRGGMLTPQGSDFEKAAFRFKKAKPLGESGVKALAIHYANLCGRGKLPLMERIEWAMTEGHEYADAIIENRRIMGKKERFQAVVAAAEWKRVHMMLELGADACDITSQLVIHQDGTCNGLQHGAALTGDRKTAEAVNCVASTPSDKPADIYGLAASTIKCLTEKAGLVLITDALERRGRDLMKLPIMVTGYGAGTTTATADFRAALIKSGLKRSAEELDNSEDEFKEAMELALQEHAGAMIALTQALQKAIKDKWADTVHWETADGFVVCQYNDAKDKDDRSYVGSGEFQIRTDTGEVNEAAQICAISPNFVHSIDATHLREVINGCPHDLVTVHDSIGSHACDYFNTGQIIRETFVTTHQFDWFGSFNESMQSDVNVRTGDYKAEEALNSTYIFS